MLSLEGCRNDLPHRSRRGWHVAAALMAVSLVGCDSGNVTVAEPASPGSIVVTTETTGFLQAEGYDLTVDGVSSGAIGANDQMTISEVEPGEYQVGLGNMPENCSADGATVSVESEQTAEVAFTVTCTYADPVTYTIHFNNRRPDLDSGAILECPYGFCESDEAWDLYVYNNFSTDPHSVIRQNQTIGVEIAHLSGVALESLTRADLDGATFTTALVGDPFDADRVILIRTDMGNVYALGNPSEDTMTQELTFDAALIATP